MLRRVRLTSLVSCARTDEQSLMLRPRPTTLDQSVGVEEQKVNKTDAQSDLNLRLYENGVNSCTKLQHNYQRVLTRRSST